MIDAVLSTDGKFALCGACGWALCPRQRRAVDPRIYRRAYVHVLSWQPEWRLWPAVDDVPAHLERAERVRRPVSRTNATVQYIEHGPADPVVRCPSCGDLNRADPRTLHVQAL